MFFSHLECSVPCGAGPFAANEPHHVCPSCAMPLMARYDLDRARHWSRDSLQGRAPNMWRYRELMPLFTGEEPVSLGEGFTPLVHARRLGAETGFEQLFIKDESSNPTNSFKARGLSAAISRARLLGVTTVALPTAGNAGNAAAAYAAAAGLRCEVFMPRDTRSPFIDECRLYGANVTLVDGLIPEAGKLCAERTTQEGWYDLSTLKEPYRAEGKKTMGYELAEQMQWELPDWVIYPTGGGTGMVGMWKAFAEMEALGWIGAKRPRMVTVQATGCAPIVKAYDQGSEHAERWPNATTDAHGLRVPKAIGDFLILRAIRASGGTALAVDDDAMVAAMRQIGRCEGVSAAPEGGATLAAARMLLADGRMKPAETVVLFNTGGALKYLDVLDAHPAAR